MEYFAGWLYKFGEQDEDIRRRLHENPRGREVAREFNSDVSAGAKAG